MFVRCGLADAVERRSYYVIIASMSVCGASPYHLLLLFDCLVFAFDKTDMLRFLRVFRTHMESRSRSKRRYDEVQPRVQRRIVAEYQQGVRGYGYIAKRLQLPVSNGERGDCAGGKGGWCIQSHRADTQEEKAEQWGGGKVVQGS